VKQLVHDNSIDEYRPSGAIDLKQVSHNETIPLFLSCHQDGSLAHGADKMLPLALSDVFTTLTHDTYGSVKTGRESVHGHDISILKGGAYIAGVVCFFMETQMESETTVRMSS